ncbi:DUF5682 family protein [Ectobacillus ponti]|uniref:DUF5682 family protein n=1 Tax=Ectobacillus ponti TaxID=2961894 RepID=A0AA42BTS0_9BACI|nr:DUF5682 family protein [Ectobacillus ponti]MCP8969763.1 DUF5682 family protein [Ectobacillus ponti]
MEGILRGTEAPEVRAFLQQASLDRPVVYMPVRHHSPACAFHVQQLMDVYQPEIILVEGPAECTPLIPHLVSGDTEAPVSMYCSYDDKTEALAPGGGKHRAYYPFLDYSPELVALREAAARGIPSAFIDLPYKEYLFATREEGELPEDHYFRRSAYVHMLAERTGCRSFHEFWEKYFELQGMEMDTAAFIRQLLGYCLYTRADYTKDMLERDGCTARELHMAKEIAKARKQYSRVLVITGGFHVPGLLELEGTKEKLAKSPLPAAHAKAYLMPYSFRESDQAEGYDSGMPAPVFYQWLWEKGRDKAAEQLMLRTARQLRGEGVSLADEIEAARMLRELALLRGKLQPGLYELTDAVRSVFVKGELGPAEKAMQVLHDRLRGTKRGKLSADAEVPPLVQDFRALAAKFRLPVRSTVPQETTLDIYKKESHRRLSQWFHRLSFLGVPFCERLRGPNLARRQHVHLMRETWRYRFSAQVESALIDLSVYGATVEEAAQDLLQERLHRTKGRAGERAFLLLEAYLSGLFADATRYLALAEEAIGEDGDFVSMTECAYYLSRMEGAEGAAEQARSKALFLFSTLDGGEAAVTAEKLLELYQLDPGDEALAEALERYTVREKRQSEVEGVAHGLLAVLERRSMADVLTAAQGYFYGSGDMQKQAPFFLRGLFAGAKELFLYNKGLLEGLSHVLESLAEEAFLELLPHLRLLFGQFTPLEVDRVAKQVVGLYEGEVDIRQEEPVSEAVLAYGMELDRRARYMLRERGLYDGE